MDPLWARPVCGSSCLFAGAKWAPVGDFEGGESHKKLGVLGGLGALGIAFEPSSPRQGPFLVWGGWQPKCIDFEPFWAIFLGIARIYRGLRGHEKAL